MAESKDRDKGDYFPFPKETSPAVPPSQEPPIMNSAKNPGRSITPRGQRFKHLSEAYRNILLHQEEGQQARNRSIEPESTPTICNTDTPTGIPTDVLTDASTDVHTDAHTEASTETSTGVPASSTGNSVTTLQVIVKSQDDLGIPTVASAARSSLKSNLSASSSSADFFGDLSPKVGGNRISFSDQVQDEMTRLKDSDDMRSNEPQNISGSTIERILDQYESGASTAENDTREVWSNEHKLSWNGSLPSLVSCEHRVLLISTPSETASRYSSHQFVSWFQCAKDRK